MFHEREYFAIFADPNAQQSGGFTALHAAAMHRDLDMVIANQSPTNRLLLTEIQAGRFREDRFYRLAVAVLKLPPLREREGDLSLLIERLLEQVNQEGREDPGYQQKNLSPGARNRMLAYHWPGNVRELLNTLRRAALWSEGATITEADLREALLLLPACENDHLLEQPLVPGFNLADLLAKVARHYLQQALVETQGNKTRAAELLGLPSYQTLKNWMEKYGVVE